MTRLVARFCALGVLALGCGEPSVRPSVGEGAPPLDPGPTRYEISEGERALGVAEIAEDGHATFAPAQALPSPCLADTLAANWKAFEWPDTVFVDASYYDPETKTHNKTSASFDRRSDDYPLAILEAFLGARAEGIRYDLAPHVPLDRHGTRGGPPVLPATFEVTANAARGEQPDNFTHLPLGTFTVNADGDISLATACEGEYITRRLTTHFAQEELVVSFSQPGERWNLLAKRQPGDLRVTGSENADVRIRYQRGEPEYFAALMTVVDRRFGVALTVAPAPSLSVSFPSGEGA